MPIHDISLFLVDFFDFMDSPVWRAWPFNAGYGDHILPAIARFIFVTLILGGILLMLRFLFGPGGPLRDEEMDREAEEMIRKEREELDEQLANNEITEFEYKIRLKKLQ